MIFLLVVILAILVSTAIVGHCLEKAPEGFEDYRGFHYISTVDSSEREAALHSGVNLVGHKERQAASLL